MKTNPEKYATIWDSYFTEHAEEHLFLKLLKR